MEFLIISNILLWVLGLVNLFLTLALIRRVSANSKDAIPTLPLGQAAPDFTAEILPSGNATLSGYLGREVIFTFVSTSCETCREVVPQLNDLASNAARSGIEMALVIDAEMDAAKVFVQELALKIPVLVAPHQSNRFLNDYKVSFVPFYVFLSAQGKVRAAGVINDAGWHELAAGWAQAGESLKNSPRGQA